MSGNGENTPYPAGGWTLFGGTIMSRIGVLMACLATSGCGMHFAHQFGPGIKGSGTTASENRDVKPFSKLVLKNSADVKVKIGPKQSVTIETDDNLLGIITTEVADETLTVSSSESFSTQIGVKLSIEVSKLEAVDILGSGDINVAELAEKEFAVQIAGSGNVAAAGKADRVAVKIRGSGEAKLFDLEAQDVSVTIAGSGDVRVNASESLNASIAGSGDIQYKGSPKVKQSIAGSGDIRPAK